MDLAETYTKTETETETKTKKEMVVNTTGDRRSVGNTGYIVSYEHIILLYLNSQL